MLSICLFVRWLEVAVASYIVVDPSLPTTLKRFILNYPLHFLTIQPKANGMVPKKHLINCLLANILFTQMEPNHRHTQTVDIRIIYNFT